MGRRSRRNRNKKKKYLESVFSGVTFQREVIEKNNIPGTPFFVYGTLRNGFGNYWNYLECNTYKEMTAMVHNADMYAVSEKSLGFPCMTEGTGVVHGELMYVHDQIWEPIADALDDLEGYVGPESGMNVYERKMTTVELQDGTKVDAYVYWWLGNPNLLGPKVESGDWKQFKIERMIEQMERLRQIGII